MKVQIIEARAYHCGAIVRRLRAEQGSSLVTLGVDPHRELRRTFDMSYVRRVLLLDGVIAGLGGLVGTLAGGSAYVWLALTREATRHPGILVREAVRQLCEFFVTKREISTVILADDRASLRFARFLGFRCDGVPDGAIVPMKLYREDWV